MANDQSGENWYEWHRGYDRPGSSLQRRLAIVQQQIRAALDAAAPGPIRVVSLCAGQGHDLIGALRDHPRAADVHARLVELDPRNCELARAAAPAGVEVFCGDASDTSSYEGAVPAHLVLANGVFGNISDEHIVRTIGTLRSFCAPGATVTWTRHRRPPDLTPRVRQWFIDAGFAEVAFEGSDEFVFGIGVNRLKRAPDPFEPGVHMFDFVGSDQNWEQGQPA